MESMHFDVDEFLKLCSLVMYPLSLSFPNGGIDEVKRDPGVC